MLVELDLTGASFSKQFKKANKLNSRSIIVIGDEEAANNEFTIRLFDKENIDNQEKNISIDDDIRLRNWLNDYLLEK